MNYITLVKEFESLQSPFKHVPANIFAIMLMKILHKHCHCVIHQLQEDPQSVLVIKRFKNLQHSIVIIAHLHKTNLV